MMRRQVLLCGAAIIPMPENQQGYREDKSHHRQHHQAHRQQKKRQGDENDAHGPARKTLILTIGFVHLVLSFLLGCILLSFFEGYRQASKRSHDRFGVIPAYGVILPFKLLPANALMIAR